MEKNEIEKIMSEIPVPKVKVSEHKRVFGLTILNTRKSAYIGILLLILPFIFLAGVVAKYGLNISIPVISDIYNWIGEIDRKYGDDSILNWIIRILLLFGPIVATAINLFAVTHFRIEKKPWETIISIKFKLLNWAIILICTLIFLIFFTYLTLENVPN